MIVLALCVPCAAPAATATTALSAKAYAHAGLVAQWDAIENAGYGLHGDVATEGWKDLVGGCVLTTNVSAGGSVTTLDNGIVVTKASLRHYATSGTAVDVGNAIGAAKKTIELAGQASYVQNRFWFCVNKYSTDNAANRLILWYEYRGNLLDQYCLYNQCYNQSTYSFGIAANTPFTATTAFSSSTYLNRYANGKLVAAATYYSGTPSATTTSSAGISLHALAYSSAPCSMNTTYRGVRVYKRQLPADEIAWNAMIDRHRFLGEDLDASYNTATRRYYRGSVEAGICVVQKGTKGCGSVTVTCGGKTIPAGETLWMSLEDAAAATVTFTATESGGGIFCGWSGDNGLLTETERFTRTLTFPALAAPPLVATIIIPKPVEYLQSTGYQHIDCGVHFTYGHKFTLRWSQASYTAQYTEDKGWGTGGLASGNAYNICGGGRNNGNYVRPYMYNANRTFTPTPELTWLGLVLYDPYEDVCTVQNTTTYTMTHLASGKVYSIAAVATPNTTSYDSGNNINLFSDNSISYRYNGIKRIYRATYETVGGEAVFDLFPVTVEGRPAYYDSVAHKLLFNAATSGADFTAGPASDAFKIAASGDVEFAAKASVASTGKGTVSVTDGSQTVGADRPIWVARGATASLTYTATPGDGCAFTGWTGDTVGLTAAQIASPTFTDSRPRVVSATFAQASPSTALPASVYVQDGLINQWDGIENSGTGLHGADAVYWKDLKGSLDLTLFSFGSWSSAGNSLVVAGGPAATGASATAAYSAIEVVYKMTGASRLLFASGNTTGGNRRWVLCDDAGTSNGRYKFYADGGATTPYSLQTLESTVVKSFAAVYSGNAVSHIFENGSILASPPTHNNNWGQVDCKAMIGGRSLSNASSSRSYTWNGEVYAIRLYSRALTDDEIRLNAIADRYRFASPDDVRYVGEYPSGHFECRFSYAPSAEDRGSVACAVGGVAQSADGSAWAAADETVTLTPSPKSGYKFWCWEGETNGTAIVASSGVMTFKGFPRTVVAHFVKSASSPVTRTLTLTSKGTKYWNDAANWSPNGVPAADDIVVVSGYGTLKVTNSTPVLASLTLKGNNSSQYAYIECGNWPTKVSADKITVMPFGAFTTPATSYNTSMSNRVWLACRDLDVQANAQINVDYKGYRNNNGRGWDGVDSPSSAAGGAYGGLGAGGSGTTLAHCYGSLTNPEDLGSGGYRYSNGGEGCYGGGAVKIEAANSVKVNGGIYARGQCTSIWGYGGGSGGSVYISTKTIDGSGTVTVEVIENWGDYGHSNGGGGRIAVHYDPTAQSSKLATCLVNFRANAGAGSCAVHFPYNSMTTSDGFVKPLRWVGGRGYDGTLYFTDNWMLTNAVRLAKGVFLSGIFHSGEPFPDPLVLQGPVLFKNSYLLLGMPLGELVVDGDMNFWGTLYMNSGLKLTNTNLRVKGNVLLKGSHLAMTENTVHIDGDLRQMTSDASQTWIPEARVGRMTIQAGGSTNDVTKMFGAEFYVGGSWTMEKYAVLYPYAQYVNGLVPYFECQNFDLQPGAIIEARESGFGAGYGTGYSRGNAGASHGGRGGGGTDWNKQYIAEPYGSTEQPVTAGSGSTFRGGGAVRIHARNRCDMNGQISATGNGYSSNWNYGSSGGSIYLSSARFSSTNASSILTVRGGNSTQYSVGAGGGGRIAIWARAYLATNMQIWVKGGISTSSSPKYPAEPGTLYWYKNNGAMFLIR